MCPCNAGIVTAEHRLQHCQLHVVLRWEGRGVGGGGGHVASSKTTEGQALWKPGGAEKDSLISLGQQASPSPVVAKCLPLMQCVPHDIMTAEHLLQHLQLHVALGLRDMWSEPRPLKDKLYGNLISLSLISLGQQASPSSARRRRRRLMMGEAVSVLPWLLNVYLSRNVYLRTS